MAVSTAAERRADVCHADDVSRARVWRRRGDKLEGSEMGISSEACL